MQQHTPRHTMRPITLGSVWKCFWLSHLEDSLPTGTIVWRSWVLPNTLQCTGCPTTENDLALNVNSAKVEAIGPNILLYTHTVTHIYAQLS